MNTTSAPAPLHQLLCDLLQRKISSRNRARKTLATLTGLTPTGASLEAVIEATEELRQRARAKKAEAINTLGMLGESAALPAILHMVERQDDHQILLDALFSALTSLQPTETTELQDVIAEGLFALLMRLPLEDTDNQVKLATGIRHLQLFPQLSLRCYETLEQSETTRHMTLAVRLLGEREDRAVLPHITRYLRQSSHRDPLCVASYEVMAALSPDTLADMLDEDIPQAVKLGMSAALCYVGRDEGAALLAAELEEHPRRDSTSVFLTALAQLKTDRYIPLFRSFAGPEGNAYNPRLAAMSALGHLQAKEAMPDLRDMMKDPTEYYSIHNAVAITMAQIEPESPNVGRDRRLRNLVNVDAETMQDGHLDMSALIQTLRGIAEASLVRLRTLRDAKDEDGAKDEHSRYPWQQYMDRLRERALKTQMIPTLLTYQNTVHQFARFATRRGSSYLKLVDACITAWQTLNQYLNELSKEEGPQADPEAFSELRSYLMGPYTTIRWLRLCTILDDWPISDDLTIALNYVNQHADGWPDEMRSLPAAWLTRLQNQTYEPRVSIARELQLSNSGNLDMIRFVLSSLEEEHNFTILNLKESYLTSRFAIFLASLPALAPFRELNLFYNNIGAKGLGPLLASPHSKGLRKLNIKSNNIGNKGVALLAKATGFDALEELNLSSNRISHDGGRALLQNQPFPALKKLDLTANNIPLDIREKLREAPHLEGVELLLD